MESDKESETDKHSSKDTNDSSNRDDAIAPQVKDSDHERENERDKNNNSIENSGTHPVVFSKAQEDSQSPTKTEKDETPGESILQTPPMQVMEASGEYDPDRIPASVFGTRPSSAMDWSVASNESLFSLHLGNNSFSREQFLMMSGELNYDDLNKSEELNKPHGQDKSGLPPLSPVGKLQNVQSMDSDKKSEQTNLVDESPKDSLKLDVEEKEHELHGDGDSSIHNRPSDGSTASCQSFAFPILVDTNTTKNSFGKGPSPRQRDMSPVVESPKMEAQANNSSSYWWCCCCCYNCCSLPHLSCASCNSFWSWRWCKKWCCCCCWCCSG